MTQTKLGAQIETINLLRDLRLAGHGDKPGCIILKALRFFKEHHRPETLAPQPQPSQN
jgi:hypothetical protein